MYIIYRRSLHRKKQEKHAYNSCQMFFLGELPQDSEVYLIAGTSLQHVLGWWSTIATDIYWFWNCLKLGMNFVSFSNWKLFANSESSMKIQWITSQKLRFHDFLFSCYYPGIPLWKRDLLDFALRPFFRRWTSISHAWILSWNAWVVTQHSMGKEWVSSDG